MPKKPYDFAGWATKANVLVSDGVVIHSDAFSDMDGKQVPLVWNHQSSIPGNVLGHVILHQYPEGTYAHGYFNDSQTAKQAQAQLEHGDISAMSIGANHIKRNGNNVIHGEIFEVSLVLKGANPGALIDEVVTHGDGNESAIIYTDLLIHSATDENPGGTATMADEAKQPETQTPPTTTTEQTPEQILASMSPEQQQLVDDLVGAAVEAAEAETTQESGEQTMQHNAFADAGNNNEILQHSEIRASLNAALTTAKDRKITLKQAMAEEGVLQHADSNSVTNMEELFPEAKNQNMPPMQIVDPNTGTEAILAGVSHLPFSRVKAMWTDLTDMTDEQARAKGYIKGTEKLDSVIKVAKRSTEPGLIYIKNKLDRQDIIDVKDFDIVPWLRAILLQKLKQELARAIMVGDGRASGDSNKIDEERIRPIWSDNDLFTIKATTATLGTFVDDVTLALGDLLGSGSPKMYANPKTIKRLTLIKDGVGRYLFGNGATPSQTALGGAIGVSAIVPTTFLKEGQVLFGNTSDYSLGNDKGGEITNFDDFDIDFNQYKYLTETYLSGALTNPKSFLALTITDPTTVPTFVIQNNQVNYEKPATGTGV